MCPACIGSALLLLTGATSAGGLAVFGVRAVGTRPAATRAEESATRNVPTHQELRADGPNARVSVLRPQ
jgi:hypothetical protein